MYAIRSYYGVVFSGILISYTGWSIIDPLIGIVIACIIIYSTWSLLHDSIRLSLDGVPVGTDGEKIREQIMEVADRITSYNVCYTKLLRSHNVLIPLSPCNSGCCAIKNVTLPSFRQVILRSSKSYPIRLNGICCSYNFV